MLRNKIEAGTPMIGICLGLQLFFEASEEGPGKGLALFKGKTVQLPSTVKVPHMGWNTLQVRREHPLLAGIATGDGGLHAYFVHSFQLYPANPDDVVAIADYGGPVTAMVGRENVVGTQFHPEKSQKLGLALIANFLRWRP